jgi:hypothetical protein
LKSPKLKSPGGSGCGLKPTIEPGLMYVNCCFDRFYLRARGGRRAGRGCEGKKQVEQLSPQSRKGIHLFSLLNVSSSLRAPAA